MTGFTILLRSSYQGCEAVIAGSADTYYGMLSMESNVVCLYILWFGKRIVRKSFRVLTVVPTVYFVYEDHG